MKRRRAALCAAIVLAASFLALDGASASSLVLDGPAQASTASLARCGNATVVVEPSGTAAADGSYARVRVSGVPSDCRRGTVRVARRSGAATWQQVVAERPAATIDTGAFEINVPAFVPPETSTGSAWVTLDGWPVPTAWTYVPPPPNRCVVLTSTGAQAAKTCAVANLRVKEFWGTAPARAANLYFDVSAPTVNHNAGEVVRVTLDLSTAAGLPSGWRWSTTAVGAGNLVAVPGQACTSLPVLVADVAAWNTNVYVPIREDREGGSGVLCS